MSSDSDPPCTPVTNKLISRLTDCKTPSVTAKSPAVHLPATPFLTKLGYGTGVSVFLYPRSPALGGKIKSPWAVKKVNKRHAKSEFGSRLEEEAKILKSLSHPNIIGYRAFNLSNEGTHALVMEAGQRSLFDIIEERAEPGEIVDPFPSLDIGIVVRGVCLALDYLHREKCLMHGDIKSGNILVVGQFDTVKLCDFGVTLPVNSEGRVSDPGARYVGTEAWSPMEVIKEEEITTKADIFAFGLVIYEMIALHSPHIDKLMVDEDSEDEDGDKSLCEEAFRAALGTRPPLPDTLDLDQSYHKVLEIFFSSTSQEVETRPSAAEILDLLEKEDEGEESILCVNMVDTTASAL